MRGLLQDALHASRSLRAAPGFVAVVAVTLAVGLGAATTVFTISDAVLLAPLPFRDESTLVRVYENNLREGRERSNLTIADLRDYQRESTQVRPLAFARWSSFTVTGVGDAQRFPGLRVSGGFFDVLGVRPLLGRLIETTDEQPGAARVGVLTYAGWRRAFGGDPAVVGRPLTLNGSACVIVGVLAPDFVSPLGAAPELYVAEGFHELLQDPARRRRMHVFSAIGRLAPGATLASARAELRTIADRLAAAHPADNEGHRAEPAPLRSSLVREARPVVRTLDAAVALLLVLAVVNVAGLLLSRFLSRQRELSVHAALGAGRARLVRRLVLEVVLVALAGLVLGLAVAHAAVPAFVALVGAEFFPLLPQVSWRVVAFGVPLAVLAGLAAGVVPALATTRGDLSGLLASGGRTGTAGRYRPRLRGALVSAQVGLACVLLVAGGLVLRTVLALQATDPGFRADGVHLLRVSLTGARYAETPARVDLVARLLERVRALPGTELAAASYTVPFEDVSTTGLRSDGEAQAGPAPEVGFNSVTPEYFRVLRTPLLRGRPFDDRDTETSPPVAIVNEALARRFFADRDPVGQVVRVGSDATAVEIVGVVGDVRRTGLDSPPAPEIFFALPQDPTPSPVVLARVRDGAATPGAELRRILRELDPGVAAYGERPLADVVAGTLAARRIVSVLLGVFASVALFLAALGVYGVASQLVVQRQHELGVRMALGASSRDVLGLVLRDGLAPVGAGLVAGLAASLAAARLVASHVHGISTTDPLTHAMVALAVAVAALAACLVPGRRAAALSPTQALREA